MKQRDNLIGRKFGKLTVTAFSHRTKNRLYWWCECECGKKKQKPVYASALRSGIVKSCGCALRYLKKNRPVNIGRKFGMLTVAALDHIGDKGRACWQCSCECGRTIVLSDRQLLNLGAVTCGCKNRAYDLTGRQFGCMTIVDRSHKSASKRQYWTCISKCGRTSTYAQDFLLGAAVPICRCAKEEATGMPKGSSYTSEYNSWKSMWRRCEDEDYPGYANYGGANIAVCDGWRSFSTFQKDMGPRPAGTTLDRINPYGNYEPGNCRWADATTQAINKKHSTRGISGIEGVYPTKSGRWKAMLPFKGKILLNKTFDSIEEAALSRKEAESKYFAGLKYGVGVTDDDLKGGNVNNERILVIVESPAKTKSVAQYIGGNCVCLASYGHIRDLPRKGTAVHPDEDFRMDYEITEDHIRHVNAIVAEAKRADVIYLASDLDREGEAIAWHVAEILKERGVTGKSIRRITFSEITKKAIQEAMKNPRQLDDQLISAQQARRALDYLVGYNLSPVLWKKIKTGLSAGRVQSPALRMIAEREDEIDAFIPKEHWVVTANLNAKGTDFKAKLTKLDGQKYDPFQFDNAVSAKALEQRLKELAGSALTLTRREAKERLRRPYAPFTTSTLQQGAASRLGFGSQKTMQLAQKLYEGIALKAGEQTGLITYMRTDAVNLSEDAIGAFREYIGRVHGPRYLPSAAVRYQNKSKNAQEAHEAIRPTDVNRTPESMKGYLDADQLKLYTLIWQRALACQMAPALLNVVVFDFDLPGEGGETTFHATGSTVAFPGFLAVYDTQKDDDEGTKLPHLEQGEKADVQDIVAEQKFTEPPPRYNEASIVKYLEEYGIGRPSTYASIIETLKRREYVRMEGRTFHATDVGKLVSRFLEVHFEPYVDYEFTARMEDDLDAVARGERDWKDLMATFWTPFIAMVKDKSATADRNEARGRRCIGELNGEKVWVFVSRFGPTIAVGDLDNKDKSEKKAKFVSLPEGLHVDTVTFEDIQNELRFPIDLGEGYLVKKGRFGIFVQKDKTYASVAEDMDPFSITLPIARDLVKAKEELKANTNIADLGEGYKVLNGSYGPYIADSKKNYASVPAGTDPKSVTLAQAKELLAAKKAGGNHGGGKKKWNGKKGSWKGKSDGNHQGGKFQKSNGGGAKASKLDGLPM